MIIPFLSEPPKLYAIEVHVILLCLKELVVEVNVVFTSLRKLTRGQQQFDEQLVQFLCRIEVIDVAGLFRCLRYVLRCQFLYAAQHCVRAWDTGLRTLRKSVLQVQVEVFHTVTTAAEHGEDGPYNLAILITCQRATKSQMGVYHRGQDRVEFVQNKKYSAKSGDFSDFCCIFAMSLMIFACLDLQH